MSTSNHPAEWLAAAASGELADLLAHAKNPEADAGLWATKNAGGNSAFHLTLEHSHESAALLVMGGIIGAGALDELGAENRLGETPMMLAVRHRNRAIIKSLVAMDPTGALYTLRLSKKTGTGPGHLAASENALQSLRLLVEAYPQAVNFLSKQAQTPLHIAVSGGHEEAVRFLVGKKAMWAPEGSTHPIWWGLQDMEVARILDEEAPIETWSAADGSGIWHALFFDRKPKVALVNALLRWKGGLWDWGRRDGQGRTALHLAFQNRADAATVDAMLTAGSKWLVADTSDNTPLDCLERQVDTGWLLPPGVLDRWSAGARQERLESSWPAAKGEDSLPLRL